MEMIREFLQEDESYSNIHSAFPIDDETIALAIDARLMEGGRSASALVTVRFGDAPETPVMMQEPRGILDCIQDDDGVFHILLSGGDLLQGGERGWSRLPAWSDEYLFRLCPVAPGIVAACGDEGELWIIENQSPRKIETGTDVMLYDMAFKGLTNVAVAGDYGTVLTSDGGELAPVSMPSHDRITCIAMQNGGYFFGTDKGGLFHLLADDLVELGNVDAPVYDVICHFGRTFWATEGSGVVGDHESEIQTVFDVGTAFRFNSRGPLLAFDTGLRAFLTDKEKWRAVGYHPGEATEFVEIDLPFTPLL